MDNMVFTGHAGVAASVASSLLQGLENDTADPEHTAQTADLAAGFDLSAYANQTEDALALGEVPCDLPTFGSPDIGAANLLSAAGLFTHSSPEGTPLVRTTLPMPAGSSYVFQKSWIPTPSVGQLPKHTEPCEFAVQSLPAASQCYQSIPNPSMEISGVSVATSAVTMATAGLGNRMNATMTTGTAGARMTQFIGSSISSATADTVSHQGETQMSLILNSTADFGTELVSVTRNSIAGAMTTTTAALPSAVPSNTVSQTLPSIGSIMTTSISGGPSNKLMTLMTHQGVTGVAPPSIGTTFPDFSRLASHSPYSMPGTTGNTTSDSVVHVPRTQDLMIYHDKVTGKNFLIPLGPAKPENEPIPGLAPEMTTVTATSWSTVGSCSLSVSDINVSKFLNIEEPAAPSLQSVAPLTEEPLPSTKSAAGQTGTVIVTEAPSASISQDSVNVLKSHLLRAIADTSGSDLELQDRYQTTGGQTVKGEASVQCETGLTPTSDGVTPTPQQQSDAEEDNDDDDDADEEDDRETLPAVQEKEAENTGGTVATPVTSRYAAMVAAMNIQQMVATGSTQGKLDVSVHIEDSQCVVEGGKRMWQCLACPKKYCSKHNLTQHILSHTDMKPHACLICSKAFRQQSHLHTHMLTHSNIKPFTCGKCRRGFTQASHLKRHMATHMQQRPHVCTLCGRGFAFPSELKFHMERHKNGQENNCDECSQKFETPRKLKNHKASAHRDTKALTCMECGKVFTFPSQLRDHMMKHEGNRPYICTECGMSFMKEHHLKAHQFTHSGMRPYTCEVCDRAFNQRANLQRHLLIHSSERKYKCQVCRRSFTQPQVLKSHMITHADRKPFECSYCGKRFSRAHNLAGHEHTHKGGKHHTCFCGSSFTLKGNLSRHKRVKHGLDMSTECTEEEAAQILNELSKSRVSEAELSAGIPSMKQRRKSFPRKKVPIGDQSGEEEEEEEEEEVEDEEVGVEGDEEREVLTRWHGSEMSEEETDDDDAKGENKAAEEEGKDLHRKYNVYMWEDNEDGADSEDCSSNGAITSIMTAIVKETNMHNQTKKSEDDVEDSQSGGEPASCRNLGSSSKRKCKTKVVSPYFQENKRMKRSRSCRKTH